MRTELTGTAVSIPTESGDMDGWYVAPLATARGSIVICPEIFGVGPNARRLASELASAGYAALAVNLAHRRAPGLDLPHDQGGRTRGLALLADLERDRAVADLGSAMAFLRELHPGAGAGLLGLSSGGHAAYLGACELDVEVAVVFYAGWLTGTDIALSRPSPTVNLTPGMKKRDVRVLFLVGGQDTVITGPQVERIERALVDSGVRHEMVVYPEAAHAFLYEDDALTADSLKRTLQVLSEELG